MSRKTWTEKDLVYCYYVSKYGFYGTPFKNTTTMSSYLKSSVRALHYRLAGFSHVLSNDNNYGEAFREVIGPKSTREVVEKYKNKTVSQMRDILCELEAREEAVDETKKEVVDETKKEAGFQYKIDFDDKGSKST